MQRWTVEHRLTADGPRNPYDQPTFRSRKAAERYARKHSCEHSIYTVVAIPPCGHGTVAVEPMHGQRRPPGATPVHYGPLSSPPG
jgi:hypothetical protein